MISSGAIHGDPTPRAAHDRSPVETATSAMRTAHAGTRLSHLMRADDRKTTPNADGRTPVRPPG